MKLTQIKILTDENISPKVVTFLRQVSIDVRDTKEEHWHGRSDEELLQIAYQEERFVLTHDADFGALAMYQGNPCYGIFYLEEVFVQVVDLFTPRLFVGKRKLLVDNTTR